MDGKHGILGNNPLLRLGLGICPAVAVTTTALNGLGMGVATAGALLLTSFVMGLIGGALNEKARFAVTLILSAAFASVAQMVLRGWFPALNDSLGVFVPLIAVSSLILCGGSEAAGRGFGAAIADGLVMGIGYAVAMTLLGAVRELLGRGTAFGAAVLPAAYEPLLLAALPAGGLMLLGIAMGLYNAVFGRGRNGKEGA